MNPKGNVNISGQTVFAANAGIGPPPARYIPANTAFTRQAAPFSRGSIVLMVFAILLIVNHLGKPFEHVLVGLKIPAVICSLAILAALALGLPALKTRVGMTLAAFFGWMLLITPLSTWRGGTFAYLLSFIQFWLVLFLVVACAPKTMRQLRLLCIVVALACFFNILAGANFANGTRLELGGTFGNSGDAAVLAGFAIPFWLFMSRQMNPLFRYAASFAGSLYLLRMMVLTATRAILISLSALVLVWFFRTTMIRRLLGIGGLLFTVVLITATTPAAVLERLGTTFEAFTGDSTNVNEASDSAAERRDLLKDGLLTTFTHPIWGVGPGQFAQYRWKSLSTPGKRKLSFRTHNTYVEVSADNGIPGLIFYLMFVWTTYRTILNVRKATASQSSADLRLGYQFATYMELAWVFSAVAAAFITMEEHPYMFVLGGLAVAAERIVGVELKAAATAQPVAALVGGFPARP